MIFEVQEFFFLNENGFRRILRIYVFVFLVNLVYGTIKFKTEPKVELF